MSTSPPAAPAAHVVGEAVRLRNEGDMMASGRGRRDRDDASGSRGARAADALDEAAELDDAAELDEAGVARRLNRISH